jgi:hypothetical protein
MKYYRHYYDEKEEQIITKEEYLEKLKKNYPDVSENNLILKGKREYIKTDRGLYYIK